MTGRRKRIRVLRTTSSRSFLRQLGFLYGMSFVILPFTNYTMHLLARNSSKIQDKRNFKSGAISNHFSQMLANHSKINAAHWFLFFSSILPVAHAASSVSSTDSVNVNMNMNALRSLGVSKKEIQSFLSLPSEEEEDDKRQYDDEEEVEEEEDDDREEMERDEQEETDAWPSLNTMNSIFIEEDMNQNQLEYDENEDDENNSDPEDFYEDEELDQDEEQDNALESQDNTQDNSYLGNESWNNDDWMINLDDNPKEDSSSISTPQEPIGMASVKKINQDHDKYDDVVNSALLEDLYDETVNDYDTDYEQEEVEDDDVDVDDDGRDALLESINVNTDQNMLQDMDFAALNDDDALGQEENLSQQEEQILDHDNMDESMVLEEEEDDDDDDEFYDEEYDEDENEEREIVLENEINDPLVNKNNHQDGQDGEVEASQERRKSQREALSEVEKHRETFTEDFRNSNLSKKVQSTKSTTDNTAALSVMLLPKLGKALIHSPIAVQLFAAGTLGNIAWAQLGWGKRKRVRRSKTAGDDTENASESAAIDSAITSNSNNLDDNIYEIQSSDFEESDYDHEDEVGGFGRPIAHSLYNSRSSLNNIIQEDVTRASETVGGRDMVDEDFSSVNAGEEPKQDQFYSLKNKDRQLHIWGQRRMMGKRKVRYERSSSNNHNDDDPKHGGRRHFAFFSGRKALELEVSRLSNEVDNLLRRAVEAESSRDQFENDCDSALQEVRFMLLIDHSIEYLDVLFRFSKLNA